jgi:hypothetical protein
MRSDLCNACFGSLMLLGIPMSAAAQEAGKVFEGFTPGACVWVPRMVERFALRDRPDTTAYNPTKDSTIGLAKDSAQVCAASAPAPAAGVALLDEARMQLVTGDDAAARATASRYSGSLTDAEKKAWALHLIVDDNAHARPERLTDAAAALAELDKLGQPAARASVLSHLTMARAQRDRWNDSAATVEATTTIAKWRTLSPDAALNLASSVVEAFVMKSEIALRTRNADAARAIIDTAAQTIPSAAGGARRQIDAVRRLYSVAGKKAAPVQATYWFNLPDTNRVRPVPGHVSIMLEATHTCGSFCRPRYRALARYAGRFGQRGFDIINFTKTVGFYRDVAPVTPVEEARYDSTLFLAGRQMPGSLAIYETKFSWLPDGRRVNERTPQEVNYPLATLVIVDKRGVIRYAALGWDPVLEEPLARLIDRLLSEDAASGTP